jgi:hypothetical protein
LKAAGVEPGGRQGTPAVGQPAPTDIDRSLSEPTRAASILRSHRSCTYWVWSLRKRICGGGPAGGVGVGAGGR